MALRFRKSVKIAQGIRMNLSKSGVGVSGGVRGARIGINSRGTYSSVGIPGTGLYAMNQSSSGRSKSTKLNAIPSDVPSRQLKTSMSYAPVWLIVLGLFSLIFSFPFGIMLIGLGIAISVMQSQKPEYDARKNLQEATKAFEKSDFNIAIEKFNAAVQILQNESAPHYHLAMSYFLNKQYDEAVNIFNKYIELAPSDIGVKFLLALAYKEAGKLTEAIQHLQGLPDMGEELNIERLIILAECFKTTSKADLAIDTLKQAPLRKKVLTNPLLKVHYMLGELYEESGKQKNALKHYEKVYMQDVNFENIQEKMNLLNNV